MDNRYAGDQPRVNLSNIAKPYLIAMLEQQEGRNVINGRHLPYKDSLGILTIGYGRNLQTRGLSESEAYQLLLNDIYDHWQELITALPWVAAIALERQQVLLDMGFNMGVPRLLGFHKMIAHVQAGEYEEAAREMLDSEWAAQVKPARAEYLARAMKIGKFDDA